jgi:hypothetical protein
MLGGRQRDDPEQIQSADDQLHGDRSKEDSKDDFRDNETSWIQSF